MFLPSFHRFYHGSWAASRAATQRIDRTQLAAALDRDVSHRTAIEPTLGAASPAQKIERSPTRQLGIGFGI
jgi:hypothetical protein